MDALRAAARPASRRSRASASGASPTATGSPRSGRRRPPSPSTACSPRAAAEALGRQAITTWDGDFYAQALIERLGLFEAGGVLRIGISHYNTAAEIDRLLVGPAGDRRPAMTIRVGVVGAGFIGRDHLAAYAGWPDARIVGVADVDAERARAAAEPYGASAWPDLASMVAGLRSAGTPLDAVSVCVPTGPAPRRRPRRDRRRPAHPAREADGDLGRRVRRDRRAGRGGRA